VYAAIALGIFLLGLVPMWLKARDNANQRDAAQRELRASQMQNDLASAAIDARQGHYEPARQTASDFFTTLRQQVDAGDASALTQSQRDNLRPMLQQRDDIITLLARSDPASADRLSDLYMAFRKALGNSQSSTCGRRVIQNNGA
jgi:hypothetical protein